MAEIFSDSFQRIVEDFHKYIGNGYYFIAYLIAMVVVLILGWKKKDGPFLFGYSVVLLLIIWFPLTAYFINKYCSGSVYWRTMWMLPELIVLPMR